MTYRQRQSKFMKDVGEFLVWLYDNGYEVTTGEFERTAMMAEYYKKIGKSNAGMKSRHCARMAMDINIFKDGELLSEYKDLEPIAIKWESLDRGNSWGGTGRTLYDYPHFSGGETPEWRRIS